MIYCVPGCALIYACLLRVTIRGVFRRCGRLNCRPLSVRSDSVLQYLVALHLILVPTDSRSWAIRGYNGAASHLKRLRQNRCSPVYVLEPVLRWGNCEQM